MVHRNPTRGTNLWPMHSITILTEFQQVAQHNYYKALVMSHVHVGNEISHMLEVANELHRPLFAT